MRFLFAKSGARSEGGQISICNNQRKDALLSAKEKNFHVFIELEDVR